MAWELKEDRPIWIQLTEQMARRIVTGVYPAGSKLPTVRELAVEAGVNPNTMQRALAQLELDGLAKADRTAGRMVTDDISILDDTKRTAAIIIIEQYYNDMAELGYTSAQALDILREEQK